MNKWKLSAPMQLALVFLLFGTLWIIFSDLLSVYIAHNNLFFLSRVQTYKGVLFMVVAAALIFIVSRKILAHQKLLQDQLNSERNRYKNELALEVLNAQEVERKKIGEELHDNVNQLLGVVKLYIEHAQVNPAAQHEMLKKSAEYIRQVITEIRELSKSLISPTLKEVGLMESINELTNSILKLRNMQIEVHKNNLAEDTLTDMQKVMVYRITQEQLNNILKHSRAEHVNISFRVTDRHIHLTIEDDGIGFDLKKVKPGLGLKNIKHRLELYNGQMDVISSPNHGCRLEAMFELNPRKH